MSDVDDAYNSGYECGVNDTVEKYMDIINAQSYDKEDELNAVQVDYQNKIEALTEHLRSKDEQILTYLTQIYELRKANEELQRAIKKNH